MVPRPSLPSFPGKTFLYLLLATFLFLSPILAPIASGNQVQDDRLSLFYSDDPDLGGATSEVGNFGDDDFANANSNAKTAGQRADFYFDTTNPTPEFEDQTIEFNEWREEKVRSFEFNRKRSRAPRYTCIPQGSITPDGKPSDLTQSCSNTIEPNWKNFHYIVDAQTTILGARGGTELTYRRIPPKQDDPDGSGYSHINNEYGGENKNQRDQQTMVIPSTGAIYVQSDFRLKYKELINYNCGNPDWEYNKHTHTKERRVYDPVTEEWEMKEVPYNEKHKIDGEKFCVDEGFGDITTKHTVKLDKDGDMIEIGSTYDDDLGGAVIGYSNVKRDASVRREELRVDTKHTLQMRSKRIKKDWDKNGGWHTEDTSLNTWKRTKSFESNEMSVEIMGDRDIDIDQTVVNLQGYDQKYLVVDISNSNGYLSTRRLWSKMYMESCGDVPEGYENLQECDENQYISNTWKTYAARQYKKLAQRQEDGNYLVLYPSSQVVTLRTTSGPAEPQTRVIDPEKVTTQASIVNFQAVKPFNKQIPVAKPNVTLPQSPPRMVNQITIRNAPGKISTVEDINGDYISLGETNEVQGRVPEISLYERDGNEIVITVTDPVTNRAVSDRKMYIRGAEESTVRTGTYGRATITRTSSSLHLQTVSDDFSNADKAVYYVSAVKEKSYYTNPVIIDMFLELVNSIIYATPFIGIYMWLTYMRDDGEQ